MSNMMAPRSLPRLLQTVMTTNFSNTPANKKPEEKRHSLVPKTRLSMFSNFDYQKFGQFCLTYSALNRNQNTSTESPRPASPEAQLLKLALANIFAEENSGQNKAFLTRQDIDGVRTELRTIKIKNRKLRSKILKKKYDWTITSEGYSSDSSCLEPPEPETPNPNPLLEDRGWSNRQAMLSKSRDHRIQTTLQNFKHSLSSIRKEPLLGDCPRSSLTTYSTTQNQKHELDLTNAYNNFNLEEEYPQVGTVYKSKLYSVGCGFSKQEDPSIVIEPDSPEFTFNEDSISRNFGEDAAFIHNSKTCDILAVSDGVGGWSRHGVDPGRFSYLLMEKARLLAEHKQFKSDQPVQFLSRAYNQLTCEPDLIGSATASLAFFDRKTEVLHTANLGDSGFLVIRNGEIIHQYKPQCHSFNAPYQLAIVPRNALCLSGLGSVHLHDTPHQAEYQQFQCMRGDIIIMASDGLFDNVHLTHINQLLKLLGVTPEELLGANESVHSLATEPCHINRVSHNSESANSLDSGHSSYPTRNCSPTIECGANKAANIASGKNLRLRNEDIYPVLKKAASTFVALARKNAHDNSYLSPFSLSARNHGYPNCAGGKLDDITVLVSIVGAN